MTLFLFLEQLFNGAQFGVTLFLIAAGLTLILGIMDFVFLAHGAQVMICLLYTSPSPRDTA